MTDRLTPQQRHDNMSAIRSRDTKPEMLVRRFLWANGFRYRLNHPRLPGKPDIVLRKYRTCIFVNGCFWHGHNLTLPTISEGESQIERVESSECCKIPKTNRAFWLTKILRNRERDKETCVKLANMGWHYITLWECELRPNRKEETLKSLAFTLNKIYLQDRTIKTYELPEEPSLMVAEEILDD